MDTDQPKQKRKRLFYRLWWGLIISTLFLTLLQLVLAKDGYEVVLRAYWDCYDVIVGTALLALVWAVGSAWFTRVLDATFFGGDPLKTNPMTWLKLPTFVGPIGLACLFYLTHVFILSPAGLRDDLKAESAKAQERIVDQTQANIEKMRLKHLEELEKARERRTNILITSNIDSELREKTVPACCIIEVGHRRVGRSRVPLPHN